MVRDIEALPEVRQIAQYARPTLANQVARTLLGVDGVDSDAGASLQNILGVILEHQALTPSKRMGNQDRPNPVGRLDRDNNVQIIRIENPPPGNYLLQLFAANLLQPQNWALVVTGALAGGLTEI